MQSFDDYLDELRIQKDVREEKWLKKRPICIECKHHIQESYAFNFGDGYVCEDCKEDYIMINFMEIIEDEND